MRHILTLTLALLTTVVFGQKTKVNLNWKIAKQDTVSYLTFMGVDTSSTIKTSENFDLTTHMTNIGNGVIDVVIQAKQIEEEIKLINSDTLDNLSKPPKKKRHGIAMRGSVYETGGIHSFWVTNGAKNMIAFLFELPQRQVQVGDTWALDIHLISNDKNFKCDSSYKKNEVTLTEIKKVNGEKIAVLKYDIIEYVNGAFSTLIPDETDPSENMFMEVTFTANAEFSIDKGRWVSYNGLMSILSTGEMFNAKTKFTLRPK